MAKSLRSKWKRKMRAIKRERYGVKELARLKKVLGIEDDGDIEMKNIANIATVVDAKSIQSNTEDIPEEKGIEEEEEEEEKEDDDDEKEAEKEVMEIDEVKQRYSKKTLRNEHGNYPVWMSKREVKKRSIGNRKRKQKIKRKRIQDKQKRKKN